MCEYERIVSNITGIRNYEIRGVSLSTIVTPYVGHRVGILSSDGDKKSKCGASVSKHGSSEDESDHWVLGGDGDGELVNDGIGEESDGSSKLRKLSHESSHGLLSVWLGASKSESSHISGCSGNSGRVSADGSTMPEKVGKPLPQEEAL